MMHILDVITIVCTGLLAGNELAVSLFVNPAVWQLDDGPQTKLLSIFARTLGKFMPPWYGLCLLLLLIEAYIYRHQQGFTLLLIAAGVWLGTILLSVFVLVPINNRIARIEPGTASAEWRGDHKKWDGLHRLRIAMLVLAVVCLSSGILVGGV